jgi:drug/metabolite transporter (DMT)-like permease
LIGRPFLYGLILLMVFCWSANYIVGKVALREFPPLLLSGLRVTLAGLVMLPVYYWEGRGRLRDRPARSDLPLLAALGILGVALNQLFFVVGLGRTTVAHSSIIISVGPVIVLLVAAALRMEKITPRKVAGMCIAIAGVAVLKLFQAETDAGAARPTWSGDLFILLSSLAFALFTVFGKRVTLQHTSITMNTWAYVGGAVALAPMTLWQAARFPFAVISARAWACLVYMAMFPSVLAYLIYYYALTHITASRVASFSYLQPLLATLMAVTLLDERLTAPVVISGLMIFAGVYITERR